MELEKAKAGAEERFWAKVKKGTDCWEWTAAIVGGYGYFRFNGRWVRAHRFAYELTYGAIPDGFEIDHQCRNRACVNPSHLEVVTCKTNILRGLGVAAQLAKKTHCTKGHPYDLFNTYIYPNGTRDCRECRRQRKARWRERNELREGKGDSRED